MCNGGAGEVSRSWTCSVSQKRVELVGYSCVLERPGREGAGGKAEGRLSASAARWQLTVRG
jgi:hypothetical protein